MLPSFVDTDVALVVITSAVIMHPSLPRQKTSWVKLSNSPSFKTITLPDESRTWMFPSPYPQQIPSPYESNTSNVKQDS